MYSLPHLLITITVWSNREVRTLLIRAMIGLIERVCIVRESCAMKVVIVEDSDSFHTKRLNKVRKTCLI